MEGGIDAILIKTVMSWFAFSIFSVAGLAFAELMQQHLLNRKDPLNERASAVFTFLFQSLLTLPIVLLSKHRTELFSVFHPEIIMRILLVTIIASFAMIFYLRSFKVKNISFSSIFISGSVVVSTTLGIMFFGEGMQWTKFAGIFLVLGSIVALNYKNAALEKNHLFGLLAGALFGITYTLDKSITLSIHPLVYIFWAFFLVAVFGFLFNPLNVIRSVQGKSWYDFKPIVISGIGYLVYNFSTFTAYRFGGEVGKVDAINNSQVFLIILFEYFILKQKVSLARKLITAAVAFAGVLMLGFL